MVEVRAEAALGDGGGKIGIGGEEKAQRKGDVAFGADGVCDLDKMAELVTEKNVIDARNLLDRGALKRRGFSYQGVGRA